MIAARVHRQDHGRLAMAVATILTLLPIWVAAIRVGLQGLIPVGDTAIMALRAPDVLSAHPPLIGMPASSASTAAGVVHFPGAWQLYWLAVPVKALGPTWGTVVAMGLLNSIWILLAIWLVWRSLRASQALVVVGVIGVFCWSIGAGMLIDSWPLKMVLVPFLVVIIAAWFTAAGDRAALVVLAIVANYAWLDHLVLALAVPLVALVGCVGYLAGHVHANRVDPDGRATRRRGFRRSVYAAGGVTLVMWLPALIDQFTHTPGNLRLLITGSDGAPNAIGSSTAAVHVVASLLGRPPFWFRGTLDDPTFYRAHHSGLAVGSATWFDIAVVVVVAAAFVALAVLAVRRRDRVSVALLVIAASSIVASLATVYAAPATTGLVPEYLYSVWATACFTWLALILVTLRSVRLGDAVVVMWAGFGVAVVFAVLNLPTSHTGYTAAPHENVLARHMSDAVVERVGADRPVGVKMERVFGGNANFLSALLVQLRRHGIEFCYPTPNTSLYDFIPDCDDPPTTIVLADQGAQDAPAGEVLFTEPIVPGSAPRAATGVDRQIRRWLGRQSSLELTAAAQRPFLGPLIPDMLRGQTAALQPEDGTLAHLADDAAFRELIILWWERSDARAVALFVGQPVSPGELYRWATSARDADLTLWVTRRR